jgi:hypothetical protein
MLVADRCHLWDCRPGVGLYVVLVAQLKIIFLKKARLSQWNKKQQAMAVAIENPVVTGENKSHHKIVKRSIHYKLSQLAANHMVLLTITLQACASKEGAVNLVVVSDSMD